MSKPPLRSGFATGVCSVMRQAVFPLTILVGSNDCIDLCTVKVTSLLNLESNEGAQ